ncbi:YopT-type cysteine protease domain-containing protein [Pasteurella multocida]|uniref:YopT-type cysteine protease domain-containing protein n=1 Tax=Pasteurella multocida TaxID=747 RepID=UPI00202333AC|nr:YopT-type cysteine protease domain-containing protein [Pasteurella multocida]URH75209.1 YopT-type cysteine protease domain-containing protein [Pasteurella multocida]URH89139.1 YopT-type cysteine protease domain-containing protein [Pasteurella multocida]
MNKNRYKLIFSQIKGCLIPVAECINSAISNGSSDSTSTSEQAEEEPPILGPYSLSSLSLLVKSRFNPISSAMQLTWKQLSIFFLTLISAPVLAEGQAAEKNKLAVIDDRDEHIKLANQTDNVRQNTKLHKTENNVIVIDIATPNNKGISDNRFEKFNIPNSAVFNNNGTEVQARSTLIGYIPHNQNLSRGKEANVILNQVTGPQESKIVGALEVLGKKADIVIANQNGITLNGVRTINSDRFVATTSELIDPNQMILKVTKGNVIIDIDGFSTDGLKYLDIIAKKIEQKQSITSSDNSEAKTDITLIAGSSEYDLSKHELKKTSGENVSNDVIAITGSSTGAMHGKNIKLIVTDKGAGVKHDGIILSENDIQIEMNEGDLELGNTAQQTVVKKDRNIRAKKKIEVKNANRVFVGSQTKSDEISLEAKQVKIRKNAEIRSTTQAKIVAKGALSIEQNAKLVAKKIDVATETLTNAGRIYGREVKLDTNNLINDKEIYAERKLSILTKGKDLEIIQDRYLSPLMRVKSSIRFLGAPFFSISPSMLASLSAQFKPGFVNKGLIESAGSAELTFKEKTSFLTEGNNFIKAKDTLTINAQNIEIDKNQDIQLGANITLNVEENFVNRAGTLATGQTLTINAENGSIYNLGGILGAGKSLKLTAKSTEQRMGNIVNQEDGLFHTLGNMTLEAERSVYNIGGIYAGKKLTVHTHNLTNDVRLSGNVSYKSIGSSRDYDISRVAVHGWHNNVYKLNLNLQEQDKTNIKVVKMGAIRSDGDFDFKGIKAISTSPESKTQLINHGLINVKGVFNAKADQVVNQMKAFNQNALASVFKNPAKITMYYQPFTRYIWTPLSGNASREFNNLESFLDALFDSTTILKSSFYSTENFSAYQLLSHIQHSPMYQKAMVQVFGAEWHSKSYDEMRNKWKNFKENPTNFIYYPSEKAKILAGKLEGKLTSLQNGEYAHRGSFDGSIQIGKHQLSLPSVEFKAEFSDKERLEEEGVDLSSITELLEMPNLFIDNSIQLEKKKLSPIEDLDEEPRKNLDTEKKHSDSSNEALSMNDESDTDDRKWSMGNDEKEMPDDKSGMSSDERGNKPPRTDPTVDYLNPDEFFENGYLLNELLQELGEEPLLKEGEDHFKRSTNLVRLGERDRQNRERREKEGYFDLPGTLEMKLEELFQKRKQQHEAEHRANVEKALLQKAKQQEKRVEERKQEEKRQAQDNLAKQVEIAKEIQQAEEIRQKEKQLAIQLQEEENKRQEEKRLAETKKRAEQQQKAKEKATQEKLDLEQQKAYEEMAKREAEASKNILFKAIDEERPKVETDPLFRTKLKYINQDDYAGANYFFNKVGLNTTGHQKVNVLGDNYFDHQVITRTIEKKVDNHLNQKYNLSDVELVKQLMDNSTAQAHELDLKLGAALTKEQQANLTQDIVWYVKTKVKGKDVFVPQVYFASETLAEVKKLQGLGTGTIRVGEAKIKAKDVVNSGTLAGRKLNVEASNKIKNQGSILSTEATRLVGRKGIENVSRSFANDELGVTVQRSQIKTEGHLHLETDKDSTIDVQASDIKAKTSFVKTGDVNLKNTHNTKHTYREKFSPSALQVLEVDVAGIKVPLLGVPSPSSYSEHTSEATSEGSTFEVDHIHFAVEKDVNQVGSKIKAKYTTGVVKGNFNTEAGKNIKHVEKEEYSSQLFTSAHASGGGTSVRYDYNSQDGGNASVDVPTNQTGVGAEAGMSFTHTKDKETVLTHTNSELQVKHGKLHVLGYADIGGVDINTKLPEDAQSKAQKEIEASKPEKAEQSAQDVAQAESNANKDKENKAPEIKELSEAEIADLMSEKSKAYFDDFAEQAKKAPENNRFELSAKEIRSNKQKDQYDREYERTTFKVGPEVEAHSAVADMVSHLVKEYRDAQNGTKQDGTVALQHASDVLNIVTGDLAGSSAKLSVERTHETKRTTETGDIVTKIGGNVTLSARSGSVNLKNVQSDEQADLTLRAKEDVNVLSGEKTRETTETVSRQKLSHGVNAGCSMMSGACTAGVSTSLEGNESYTSERETTQNNSLLKVRNMKVEAGRDFNVVSSNIDSNKLDLHVKGKTNVVSKQDTLQKVTHGVDYNFSAGVAASSATIATPTGNIGFGYTNETETKRTVNQQAGIKANKITGQTHDVNLKGGYLVSNDNGKNLKVIGQVSSQELHDQHDKDGGSFGASVGISERGTTAFNLRGGRAEQKHYNATHKSTLSGVDTSQANVSGQVNTDLAKAKAVTRDDTYASTQFSFEVADIVELGQRAKNKLRASTQEGDTATPPALRTSAETDDVSGATTLSRGVDETDSVSVKNPIYESADAVVPTSRSRNGDSADLVDNPLYASASTKTNVHDYEDIPAVYSKVGDNNADLVRQRTAAGDEHVYAEISEPTYSRVGDNNADMRRHNVAGTTDNADVAQARTRKVDDPLPALPNQGKVRTVNDSSEHIYADIRDVGIQTKAIDSTYATVGVPKANAVDSTYATVEAPKVKTVETTYATVDMPRAKAVESEYATVAEPKRRKVRNVTDELPALPNESKVKTVNDGSEHIYADIRDVGIQTKAIDSTYATVGVPKANAVDSTYATVEAPKVNAVDSTYATVDMPRAKAVESEYATVTEPRSRKVRRATDELPALPNQDKARMVSDVAENLYAEISDVSNKAKRSLPAIPDNQTKIVESETDSDYATIGSGPVARHTEDVDVVTHIQPRAKRQVNELAYESIPFDDLAVQNLGSISTRRAEVLKSTVAEEVTPTLPKHSATLSKDIEINNKVNIAVNLDAEVSSRIPVTEDIYATINKSPEARAKANAKADEALVKHPIVKAEAEDDIPPTLPIRPELKDAASMNKRFKAKNGDVKSSETEGTTVSQKIKSFFSGSNSAKQTEKIVIKDNAQDTVEANKTKPVSERVQQKELVEQSRGVLKKAQDQFQPLKVKHKIDAVRASVEEYGGEVSFKYAQSKGEVYKEIVKHIETQNGVCESTCAHWIVNKVTSQSEDFWNTMYEGGKKGHLKQETIDSIKKLQTEFMNSGSATQQFKLTDSWLQEQGVVPKEKKVGSASRRDEVAGTVSKSDISALTKAILDTGSDISGVKKISINLEGGSHTVSAAVQGQKVVFLDPNFGEMTFPSHQKFETWLKEAFWNKSGYAGKNDGKRFFNVVNYELPANAEKKSGSAKFATEANDVNFNRKVSSAFEANDNIQIKRDDARGENYVTKNNVVTAITNTDYIPKPVTDVDAQFEKVRKKAKSTDRTKEAEKKLALIAKEAKNLPKAHLLNATDELLNGPSAENVVALIKQSQKEGKPFVKGASIDSFEGENAKNAGKIFKNIQFDESYVETRKQINDKLVEKLEVNKEFHDLMNSKLSGNEAGIRKLFEIVESAKRESLQEVTGISGKKATLALDIESSPLSTTQGYYVDDKVHLNTKPILSFLKNKKQNNKEILDTIVHELTHHDQMQIAKNKNGNISDAIKLDAKLLDLNKDHYIDSEQSFSAYKKQPLEREAYSSGQELSDKLSKLVERGYMGGKVQNIQTIEHLPNKLNNLESPRAAQSELGDNALIYGLKYGRKELIAAANAADAEGKNAILADSYVGKLNLGFEFGQLSAFAKQVKAGKVSEQDIQELASFNDATLKNARKDDSKHRINDANVEDNQRIIRELIQNENAVDALKRIATLSDQEQEMYNALRKNEKFDMEELNESASYSAEENAAIRAYKETQTALNEARVDFFTEKTKFIAKETLERGGQLYFALDGMATDTPTFRENTKIDLNRLKEVFDPSNPFYDSVTSRELRFLYENYKDHPNLKFTIKNQVIENPLKTLEIPTAENIALSAENTPVYNKKLLPNVFKQFKRKEKSEGPKIEHLGSSPDKDSFYFPLDKIVTKDRGISKDMKVNLENIKKAFNPKDKHYNSAEAKSLRALYEQDPTMSSTRFVIGNQVIENPFKSQDLQDYIQKYHVTAPAVVKKAKPLPTLPTKATVSKESVGQQSPLAVDKKRVQSPNLKVKAEQMADPNAIYAQVNKKKTKSVDTVEGFYPESQLKTRSDKIVEQVSQAPTTEPVYADLHFRNNVKAKSKQTSSDVVYEEIAPKAKGHAPKTLEKPQKPKAHLHKGLIPESQLKTRSDKIVEQASQAPTTEPVYADLHFHNNVKVKSKQASSDVAYEEIAPKVKGHTPKTLEKPQKPKAHLHKGLIPESQLKTRSDKIVEQVSQMPTTEPIYADLQFPVTGKTQRVISSQQETIYEEVGKKPQEEPIYQNVIRKSVNNK